MPDDGAAFDKLKELKELLATRHINSRFQNPGELVVDTGHIATWKADRGFALTIQDMFDSTTEVVAFLGDAWDDASDRDWDELNP